MGAFGALRRSTGLALVVLAVAPGAAVAQSATPNLTGERFHANTFFGDSFTISCRQNADGTETYAFTGSGSAFGPYPGTFSESGEFTVHKASPGVGPGNFGPGDVVAFSATFTIDSSAGRVTGSKRLPGPPVSVGETGCAAQAGGFVPGFDVAYSATITTSSGTVADRGRASFRLDTPDFEPLQYEFREDDFFSNPGGRPTVALAPKNDANLVGAEHCLTATVRDGSEVRVAGARVRFLVLGPNSTSATQTTDQSGVTRFCYTGRNPGQDRIVAFVDFDRDGAKDAQEPSDFATKSYERPARLTLAPESAESPIDRPGRGGDTEHCVTVAVENSEGKPLRASVMVRLEISGANNWEDAHLTSSEGRTGFCYGPNLGGARAGLDTITAYADTDRDAVQDPGEPADSATMLWSGFAFGRGTPGSSFVAMSSQGKRASPFFLSYGPVTVTWLRAYLDGNGGGGSGSQVLRAVIYSGSAQTPGRLLAQSEPFSMHAGRGALWDDFKLPAPVVLGPGYYWLGLHSSETNRVARFAWRSRAGSRRFNVDFYGDGASDPFGSAASDDHEISIHALGARGSFP